MSGRVSRAFYVMVLPAVVLFFVFHTIPVVQGIYYSFTDSPGYGPSELVGFRNYIALFTDGRVLHAYWFTFLIAAVATILVNVVSLAIALGLNGKIKFKTTLRGVYFIPNVLAILVIGYIFSYLFNNSLPALATQLGIDSLSTSLLTDAKTAWIGIVILAVWQAAAFNIIIYIAGLQTVPAELYEAASIDGASAWRQFRSVTFPMIAGFFTINMVLSLKSFLQIFDHIIALTNGGPGTDTESVSVLIYKGGFQGGEYGYQSANSVVFFVIIVALSITQLRVLQRREVSV
ncbi:carbohydrate ABC transporter permease [Cryptosporangium aurantiacum]|uniref:Carbohydrate ABC transporter membrane protein 1, CUT1 family n=1 Tax=Cryptosporangium aurantiacum TaxID=134849 RepID=A0A1M7RQ47_9ACTN|nr:sugar ABC transporter permease [Cryptosporangium aurantiacum]SHN48226.1 carbohydrate ABC transporter membrane protein 1, CUT1 family [Cryptosporangium aurantiacum]